MGASVSGPERRIVLVGKTGDGKSSAGNTILREQKFPVKSSPNSETSTSELRDGVVEGRRLTIIDTPGIFDTDRDEETLRSEIIESVVECAPGVDAVVIVLKVGRHTEQEMKIMDKISEYCGEETFERAVVLFTHGEQLEDQTIEEFVHLSPKLEEPVNKCGGRCHVIDSKYWNTRKRGYRSNRVQVRNLLETIDKMAIENSSYTNELLQMVEEEIQEEIENMREDSLSPEVRRERAKKNVVERLLIRLAGVTTGTLIGAFLGIGVALASVVAILKPTRLIKQIGLAVLGAAANKAAVAALGEATAAGGAAAAGGATAAAAGGAVAVGTTSVSVVAAVVEAAGVTTAAVGAATVEAGIISGAAAGAVAVEASVAAGAVAVEASVAAGAVAVEAGAGIGVAAGSGIAAGVILGVAGLAGAIGGGVTGYRAADEADSVLDAIRIAAKANYENAKGVVRKAEQLPSNISKMLQND